jgi:hypothetical protein
VTGPAIELASPIGADGDDELGVPDLVGEMKGLRSIDFFRTVHGEAVGRAPERAGEERNLRGVGAEVGVQVRCA